MTEYFTPSDSMVPINTFPQQLLLSLGRQTGDAMIQSFCSILEKVGDSFGIVGRNGGNEFMCVINQCTDETISQFADSINAEVEAYNPELLVATYNKLYCKQNS